MESRGRQRSRDQDASRLTGERFGTPASWVETSGKRPSLGAGEVPGRQSQGAMPPEEWEGPPVNGGSGPDSLERAIEKEMMERLHQENLRLKQELETLQQSRGPRTTPSSWSAVSPEEVEGPIPPPPRSRTPTRSTSMAVGPKFTPHGTRVPEGPPPEESTLPDLPAWPFSQYETCEEWRPCPMMLGQCLTGLPHDQVSGHGARPRQERREPACELGRDKPKNMEMC